MIDCSHYTFELYHVGSPKPLRTKVIITRKGVDQATAELPALTAEYRWQLVAVKWSAARFLF